jgi:hypothetical protein
MPRNSAAGVCTDFLPVRYRTQMVSHKICDFAAAQFVPGLMGGFVGLKLKPFPY